MEGEKTSRQKVVEFFLANPTATNLDISANTGVSKSSVQRILSDPRVGCIRIPKTNCTISEQILVNTKKGRQKGGRTTFQTHRALKDEQGRFIGTVEETEEIDKESLKEEDIRMVVVYFSKNSLKTMSEIADDLEGIKTPGNPNRTYTRDYVYRCLTDPRVEEVFGPMLATSVCHNLDLNRYGILKKLDGFADLQYLEEADLTEHEKAVLSYRFSQEGIHSADDAAEHFGCSRNAILKTENRAIQKMRDYQAGIGQK